MEPIAISKATIGLDQSDAAGAVPSAQGTIAPELFVALLAQALPATASAETPANPALSTDAPNAAAADLSVADATESMVSALAAASLTAQRGVQMAQGDVASPALVTLNSVDVPHVVTPALTVSVPTVDSEIDAEPALQLVVKADAVNHDLVMRVTPTQLKSADTEAALEDNVADMQADDVPVEAAVAITSPVPAVVAEMPAPHPLAATIALQPDETYGPVLPASNKVEAPVADVVALTPVITASATETSIAPEHDDVMDDHVTVKLEAKTDDTSATAQTLMMAQFAPHVQIIEARVVTQQTDKVEADADQSHDQQNDATPVLATETKSETQIFEIDPALAAQLTVQAPPANTASQDAASEPDLVQHRRATMETPVVLMKQAEVARAEMAPTKGSTLSPAPAAQKIENHSEPVVTYTVRNQANNGDANSYDGNDAQQNEPHHDQPQKNNPTFARANSASVKEDGMTITTDAVLARVEGATKDIRDLARFNMREVEVSLASTTSVETVNTTPVATTDTTAQTPRADTSNVEQTQTTSASDDTRRAAANDVRLRALERMVVTAAREGSDTIKMQLYPPGLGQVIIRLNMEGSRLRLSTRTSNADATEALQKIEQGLREALSMNGLDLTQFDVSEDGQERDRAARQQAEQPQPKRGGFSDEVFAIDMNA